MMRGNKKRRLKKPLRQLHPLNQEKSYQKALRGVVKQIKIAVDEYLIPQLPYLLHDVHKNKPTALRDDTKSDTDRIFKKIKLYLDENVDEEHIAKLHAAEVNSFQAMQWRKQILHMFDINIFTNEPWLKDHLDGWVNANVGLIKSLEDTALSQIEYQVKQGFVQGLRHESISDNIEERLGVAESRADLIGRDQVSKLNGQLNELRQTDLGITDYVWRTAGDERVRESHAENDGETFGWDDPPEETGHPGEDINCRCIAEPVFSEDLF
jgi:SPP1 gp7 family putative phage head morphogenesis protein